MSCAAVEELLNHRLATQLQAIRDMQNDFKAEITELLCKHESNVLETLAEHKVEVLNAIGSSEVRVSNAVIDGVSDLVDEKILEEAEEIQASIMERITSMPLRAELPFPEHPLY